MKKVNKIPICFVCGSRMGKEFSCNNCGYDLTKEYELAKTIGLISSNTISICKKREVYTEDIIKARLNSLEMKLDEVQNNQKLQKVNTDRFSIGSDWLRKIVPNRETESITDTVGDMAKKIWNSISESNSKEFEDWSEDVQADKDSETNEMETKELPAEDVNMAMSVNDNETLTKNRYGRLIHIGEVISFGAYPQTSDGISIPIEWKVLRVRNDCALIQSVMGVDTKPYHNEKTDDVTWDNCTLRGWLNNEFFEEAFSEYERSIILKTKLIAEKNPLSDMSPGNDTIDKVFLLSVRQAERYYWNNGKRKCKATAYAVNEGALVDGTMFGTNCSPWWLRAPGISSDMAVTVDSYGSVDHLGEYAVNSSILVRPAMWVRF